MANPIRRLVQLVLDKTAAKRTENDAKKSLKGVEGSLDGVRKMAMRVGAALAAAFGVRAIAGFLKSSVKAASEAEGIWNRLGHAVEGTGIRYQAVEQDIRAMAAAMQDATKVGDEEFAATLTELITTSKDYEGSLRNISLVADLAAAKQIDLRSAAQLVGRAMVGQTGTLARYGIVVKEGEDAIEVMRASFAGFAANEATTFEGKLVQVNNAWGDFKEALGDALIAGADGETMLDRLTRAVQSLTEAVDVFGRAYAGVSETAFRNQGAITRIVAGAQTPEQALRGLATYQSITAKELEDAQKKLDGMTGTWATIKGTLKKGDLFAWQTEVESAQESVEGLRVTMAHLDRVMEDIEAGRLSVGTKLPPGPDTGTGTGTRRRVPIEQLTGRNVTERGLAFQMPKMEKMEGTPELSIFTQQMEELARTQEAAHTMAELLGGDYESLDSQIQMLTGSMETLAAQGFGPMDARMQGLAERLREVQAESALVVKQQRLMADVAQTAGDILAAAMGAGIGPMAAWKAKQNAVMALEQAAMGFVASLNPFTAPLAAGHYAAAGQFAGIAAAWGTLAGVTGGFGGGGTGGFSGTGRSGAGLASERAQPPGAEVSIYLVGEGFDAINPRVQRVVHQAGKLAQESYGANARVRTFRGTIPQGGRP
jgi:hypothetical protein